MPDVRRVVDVIASAVGLARSRRAASSESALRTAVLASEDARFAAMVRGDTDELREALDDGLSYVHSTGRRETKERFLATLGSGALRYLEFTLRHRDVKLLSPAAAAVVGRAHVRMAAAGQPRTVDVWYTAVYTLDGGRWRLAVWQTTLIPP